MGLIKKDDLHLNLQQALDGVIRSKFRELDPNSLEVELSLTKDLSYGDFSTHIAFKIGSLINKPPWEVGKDILKAMELEQSKDPFLKRGIKKVELKPPGFINFFVSQSYLYKTLSKIVFEKDNFGSVNLGKGKSIQIEFVSANPTGPLSIAHGRQAAVGDALANIFSFLGYRVVREYYINDEGIQIENLAKSIWARFCQQSGKEVEFPSDGYRGDYIVELAQKIPQKNHFLVWNKETEQFFSSFGTEEILVRIKKDLEKFGVKFDHWVSQANLRKSGEVEEAISFLKKKNFIYEKDRALWLRSTKFGDDKDRVVVKSDGSFTYIASDIAYHKDKYERGFHEIINLWGPDHHGYIGRLKAAVEALGFNSDQLKILIVQLVTLYRQGKVVPMSTRAGNFITLEEVMEEIGKDVARFFFLSRALDSHLEFDLARAKDQSLENPVYYIQYANARITSIFDYAKKNKIEIEVTEQSLERLESILANLEDEELNLVRRLQQFPYILISVSRQLEPHILVSYLETLAKSFHQYYDRYRIVGQHPEITRARIFLVWAVGIVIRNGLKLLGISFPDRM